MSGRGIRSSQDGQCVVYISYNFYVAFLFFRFFYYILSMDYTKSINYCWSPFFKINLFINNKYGAEQTKHKIHFPSYTAQFFFTIFEDFTWNRRAQCCILNTSVSRKNQFDSLKSEFWVRVYPFRRTCIRQHMKEAVF